jgi:hypothetical protein
LIKQELSVVVQTLSLTPEQDAFTVLEPLKQPRMIPMIFDLAKSIGSDHRMSPVFGYFNAVNDPLLCPGFLNIFGMSHVPINMAKAYQLFCLLHVFHPILPHMQQSQDVRKSY